MNYLYVTTDRVTVATLIGPPPPPWGDPVTFFSHPDVIAQTIYRDIVLTPREHDGEQVLAAYDRELDTLFIKQANAD